MLVNIPYMEHIGYVCDMLVIPLLIYVLTMALLGLSVFFEGKRAKSLGLQSFVSIQFI